MPAPPPGSPSRRPRGGRAAGRSRDCEALVTRSPMPAAAAVEARMMWAMRFARFHPAPTSRRRRRRQRGQGMVEFALVAPVFFFVIFAMIDGGFLLFSVNAVDQATTIGTNSIAALGKVSTADITAMQRIAASPGLRSTSLIDVAELVTNSTGDGFQLNSDGTPQVQTGCGSVSALCVDEYQFSGPGTNPT